MAHVEKMVTREVQAAKSEGFVKCPEKIRYIRWTSDGYVRNGRSSQHS